VVFAVVWCIGYARLHQTDLGSRDTVESLLEDAQPISAFESRVVGDSAALTSGLVFVEQRPFPYGRLVQLDNASQTLRTVFSLPDGALVYQLAPSPDPDTLLMTYSTPESHYDSNGIYALDLRDGTLSRLVGTDASGVYIAHPQQVGDAVYYGVYERDSGALYIERYDTVTRAVNRIADAAVKPLVTPDGLMVAYLRVNPVSGARSLWVAGAMGEDARELVGESVFADIDLPTFSSDGAWIYFTVLETQPLSANRVLSVILGESPVLAHGNHSRPAHWVRVATSGGGAETVTADAFVVLHGALSSADTLGFVTDTGFYVTHGGRTAQVIQSRVMRSFVWLSGD